jgi:hypothetical protein
MNDMSPANYLPSVTRSQWPPEDDERLRELQANGASASRIAAIMNEEREFPLTRNAVIGRLNRMGVKAVYKPRVRGVSGVRESKSVGLEARRKWTDEEIERLRELGRTKTLRECAEAMARGYDSVSRACQRHKIATVNVTHRSGAVQKPARPKSAVRTPGVKAPPQFFKSEPAPETAVLYLTSGIGHCKWLFGDTSDVSSLMVCGDSRVPDAASAHGRHPYCVHHMMAAYPTWRACA